MANWKKMAEAFGRALGRPDIRNEMNTFGKNSKQGIKDRQELFDTMNRSAVNNDAEDEFMTGLARAEDDNTEIARRTGNRDMSYDERQSEFDKRSDERTDRALEENRQKEWDDAFASAKERVKRDYGDDYPKDMAGEGADTFEKQLWDVINELKAQGRSVDDILGALKSMGEK